MAFAILSLALLRCCTLLAHTCTSALLEGSQSAINVSASCDTVIQETPQLWTKCGPLALKSDPALRPLTGSGSVLKSRYRVKVFV